MKTIAYVALIYLLIGSAVVAIAWAYNYISSTMIVNYTFDVPQKFNATYFTLDMPRGQGNIWQYTPFPYVVHDWAWEGQTISLTVDYWVLSAPPQLEQDFNGTNITVAPIQPVYQLVGSEEFRFVVSKDFGGS